MNNVELKVAVVIPWRFQPDRRWGLRQVLNFYHDKFPQYHVYTSDSFDPLFNLAAARNIGVKELQDDYDVIVINDADTIPQEVSLLIAVVQCTQQPGTVLPYTEYRSLQRAGTNQYASGTPIHQCNYFPVVNACSGVYVQTPSSWLAHHGQDPRFRGWGYEDAAWEASHISIHGQLPARVDGSVYSFHHDSQRKQGKQFELNAALCYRYQQAQGDAEATRAIFNELTPDQIPDGRVIRINV